MLQLTTGFSLRTNVFLKELIEGGTMYDVNDIFPYLRNSILIR
jgi:hypothetical protein